MRHGAPLLLLSAMASLSAAVLAQGAGDPEAAQVARGRALYAKRCAVCHGRDFEGVEEAPALVGARFEAKWRGRQPNLYIKIKFSMPQDDPGTLSPGEAADLFTVILAANRMPAAPKL